MFSRVSKSLSKRLNKCIAVVCVFAFTIVNMTPIVLATSLFNKDANITEVVQDAQYVQSNRNLQQRKKELLSKTILGKRQDGSKDFLYVKDLNDINTVSGNSAGPQGDVLEGQKIVEGLPVYSLAQLQAMGYADMMNAIARTSWENISDLFQNTAESKAFYNDTARFKYMMSDLAVRGSRFNSESDEGIPTIVEVLRSGFFVSYHSHEDYPELWNGDMAKMCMPALRNMINNPYCNFGTGAQDRVIEALGALIGNTTCDLQLANQCTKFLSSFRVNSSTYLRSKVKSDAVYSIMKGIGYIYYTETYNYWGQEPSKMPSYDKLNSFIDELIAISSMTGLGPDDEWFTNNGVYYLGQLSSFYRNLRYILDVLTRKMDQSVKYTEGFFLAASQIDQNYNGINFRGEDIQYKQLQKEGHEFWLPNKYTFDDGKIQIHTGDKVSTEKIQRMYWATKEVSSQFFRVYGNDKALEPNNADTILTIKIFNSPKEYVMNYYLNGIPTDNGGMYIEPTGTFYTYERKTPEDSVYTLEELFRHEFTHYLQSRYQIPGMWGEGDFYKNNELEWFDEGTAEFFAGSTRTEGVQPRETIIGYISERPYDRYKLNTLFRSGYASGWAFYNYGWAYISYIYNNDIGTLMAINDTIMKYDIMSFRNILQSQANNASTESAYQAYMAKVKMDTSIGTPLVGDAYTQTHAKRNLSEIKKDIISVSGINNFTESKATSPGFSTFKLEGVYTGTASQGKTADWRAMNAKANDILKSLSTKGWTGYNTVTCYFTDYKVQDGAYQFNIVFRGLLNDNNVIVEPENQAPIAVINANPTAKINETVSFSGNRSTDPDGRIISYAWNFGDGSTSNEVNPNHMFVTAGTYNVTLKVTDDKGAIGQINFSIVIAKNEVIVPGGGITAEIGDNNTAAEADKNGFIGNNNELVGAIGDLNDKDYYAFEVDKEGEVNINVTCASPYVTWVVYKATNLNSYVTWPQQLVGNLSTAKFNATRGKYYIVLYPYANVSKQNYSILINGIKSYGTGNIPPVQEDVIYEQEPNDYGTVPTVAIRNNIKVIGMLKSGDSDLFYFDVASYGKVNINVSGNGNNYTWVVYREDNQGNYVCWTQNHDENGMNGDFQATSGRYYIMLYEYGNSSVNYTVNISGIK